MDKVDINFIQTFFQSPLRRKLLTQGEVIFHLAVKTKSEDKHLLNTDLAVLSEPSCPQFL